MYLFNDNQLLISESFGFVRTLTPLSDDSLESSLYVGTTKNCILEGSLNEKFRSVVQVCAILYSLS